jgi:hypothetical protein
LIEHPTEPEALSGVIFMGRKNCQAMPALFKGILDAMHNTQIIPTFQAHNDQVDQPALALPQVARSVILYIIVLLD